MKEFNKIPMPVSEKLDFLIKKYGYNVNSFSVKIGVDSTTIHYIIRGKKDGTKSKPSFKVLQKISKVFNSDEIYWLISDSIYLNNTNQNVKNIQECDCENTLEQKEKQINKLEEENRLLIEEKNKLFKILDQLSAQK